MIRDLYSSVNIGTVTAPLTGICLLPAFQNALIIGLFRLESARSLSTKIIYNSPGIPYGVWILINKIKEKVNVFASKAP